MLRSLRGEFRDVLRDALEAEGIDEDDLGLEDPPEEFDAVVASNLAFRLASRLGEAPPVVAQRLHAAIDIDETRYIEAIEAVGPYLNATPSDAYYHETIDAARAPSFAALPPRDISVVVEHTSANPTGPVHIGRARNPIIGDAVARLLDAAGYEVETHYYVNDAGRQMALFTWAYETFDADELPAPERDRIEYDLVRYYRKGNEYLEQASRDELEEAEAEINAIMQGLEVGDDETYERVSTVVDQVLDGMTACLGRLPATFDQFVKETSFMRDGSTDALVARLKSSAYAEQDDGAWQLVLDDWDIDKPFVFLRSDGTSLYTTRDLAHHEWKFENFDKAVTILGEGHGLQAEQLRAALDILGNDTDRLEQILYGWVNLPGGESMSTRRGTGIQLDDLLDEAIDRARAEVERRMDDRIREDELDEQTIEQIGHDVGIGAVRYDIVSKQPTKAITFEWDRALDFEAQSAPFVQYVHARCCGIIDRAEGAGIEAEVGVPSHESEIALTEAIARFPYEIETAADTFAPHRISTYLLELADAYNAFYRDCPVIDASDDQTASTRLALVDASRQTVESGLNLLGIAAPRSM